MVLLSVSSWPLRAFVCYALRLAAALLSLCFCAGLGSALLVAPLPSLCVFPALPMCGSGASRACCSVCAVLSRGLLCFPAVCVAPVAAAYVPSRLGLVAVVRACYVVLGSRAFTVCPGLAPFVVSVFSFVCVGVSLCFPFVGFTPPISSRCRSGFLR